MEGRDKERNTRRRDGGKQKRRRGGNGNGMKDEGVKTKEEGDETWEG